MKTSSLFSVMVLSICITACSQISEKDLAELQSPNDLVKREAIQKISKQERLFNRNVEKRAVAILVELLDGGRESEDIQLSILKALGELGKRIDVPISSLIEKLGDENPRIRLQAVESLGKIKNGEAVQALLKLLEAETDKYPIIWALGEIGDKRAISALNSLLASKDEYLRYNARKALEKIR